MKKNYPQLLLFILFGILSSYAQTVDETFVKPIPYNSANITVIKELPNGKILLGGDIHFYKDKSVNSLVRLNADHTLDKTFTFNNPDNLTVLKAEFQSNGNIIVLAQHINPYGNSVEVCKIFQLNADGKILNQINSSLFACSLAIQNNDKIIIGGGGGNSLHRYNSDLSDDPTFNSDNSFNASVTEIKVFGNSIYAAGLFTAVNGVPKNSLVKLNSEGIIDNSFDVGIGSNGYEFSMTFQNDGKILISGNFLHIADNQSSYTMCRLNTDGTIDSSFSCEYFCYASSAIAIKDSSIYINTEFDSNEYNSHLIRIDSQGKLDPGFSPVRLDEFGQDYFAIGLVGNKIFYNNCENTGNKYGLSVCDTSGNIGDYSQLKPSRFGSFDTGDSVNGKLIIKGDFIKINDVETSGIALLNADGSVDKSFVFPKYLGEILQFQVIDNSTIFVSTEKKLLKLNNNGDVLKDFDFKNNSDLSLMKQFKVLENGKIAVTDQWGLYLLNEEGIQVGEYKVNSDPNFWVTNLTFEVQNNKLVCAADLNSYINMGSATHKLYKFNLDTTPDPNFDTGKGADSVVNKIKILDSDEIIVTGVFKNYNGISTPGQIVKLSKDGKMDLQFNVNQKSFTSENRYYDYKKIEQINSVIYITEGNSNVTAINLDGSPIPNFAIPVQMTEVNDLVALEEKNTAAVSKKTAAAADKYIFAIGKSSDSQFLIVKINVGDSSGTLSPGPAFEELSSTVQAYPIPVINTMNLSFSNLIAPTKIAVFSINGDELYSEKVKSNDEIKIDFSKFATGTYVVKLFSNLGVYTKKIIKE